MKMTQKGTSNIKAKIDNTQKNTKRKKVDYAVKNVKRLITVSECSKIVQKDKRLCTKGLWKMVHREQCKRLKFDQTT